MGQHPPLCPAVEATQRWLERVVIGLNFCPFAKREWQNNSIAYLLVEQSTQALDTLINQLYTMQQSSGVETSLLIMQEGFSDFDAFLELISQAEVVIEQGGYRGEFQLAHFHPDYLFEGEPANDASHYTNRAPYPMLHILREASLERVLNTYSNPEQIPQNNIANARKLGKAHLCALLEACKVTSITSSHD